MIVLAIGDVVGKAGCDWLRRALPDLKRKHRVDLVVANGENAHSGNGLTPSDADFLLSSGVDVITGGNHTFRQQNVYDLLDESYRILRPANFPDAAPGKGYALVDMGYTAVAVINLMGLAFLEPLDCPFEAADRLIARAKADGCKVILIDFHAEATSEKRALGFYLDGQISALFGTHTHVQTSDAQVLPGATGYITDLGMTGPAQSVLGVKPEASITRLKDKVPVRFVNAEGPCVLEGCLFDIDEKSGACRSATAIRVKE